MLVKKTKIEINCLDARSIIQVSKCQRFCSSGRFHWEKRFVTSRVSADWRRLKTSRWTDSTFGISHQWLDKRVLITSHMARLLFSSKDGASVFWGKDFNLSDLHNSLLRSVFHELWHRERHTVPPTCRTDFWPCTQTSADSQNLSMTLSSVDDLMIQQSLQY